MPVLPTSGVPFDGARVTRRGFMAAGIAGGLTLAGCGHSNSQAPSSAAKMAARDRRRGSGAAAQRAHRDRQFDSAADTDRPGRTDRADAGLR